MRPADIAHSFLPWLAIAATMQVPLTEYLSNLGVPLKITSAIFGAIGLIVLAWSKHTDSQHNATVVTSPVIAPGVKL